MVNIEHASIIKYHVNMWTYFCVSLVVYLISSTQAFRSRNSVLGVRQMLPNSVNTQHYSSKYNMNLNTIPCHISSTAGINLIGRQVYSHGCRPQSTALHVKVYDLEINEDEEEYDDGKSGASKKNDPVCCSQEWMFFDVAKISVKGGDGGDGCMAMRREFRLCQGGPSGGNGGGGGNVYLVCDENLNTLGPLRRKVHHTAKDGTNGRGDSRHGKRGEDCEIPVPPGTVVRDENGLLAGELNRHGDRLVVAKGGRGGRGNEHFKTPRMTAPNFCEKGEKGDERWLNVELKLVADIGFVGVPNAGKSTLLAACSNAKPKIADYAFTTIVPNLGVCDIDGTTKKDGKGLVLADIPGLLEGAHDGIGLGIAFLRHIQRCRVLLHIIRGDSEDPLGDFIAINQELELFNPKLAKKPQVVVINKVDISEVKENLDELITKIKAVAGHSRVMGISAATGQGVKELMRRMNSFMDSMPVREESKDGLFTEDEERVDFSKEEDDNSFEIFTDENFPGQFRVVGNKIERIVRMTNWNYFESLLRFQRILEAQGIHDALKEHGAKEGDLVMIDEYDFDFIDRKNRWMTELGLENTRPRHRPAYQE